MFQDKKADLVGIIIIVIFGVFMFLIFSPLWLGIIPEILELPAVAESTGISIMVASIPFVAFLGILIWVYRKFSGTATSGGFE